MVASLDASGPFYILVRVRCLLQSAGLCRSARIGRLIIQHMVECVFTLDYEIYGNGTGALRELVYEPAERLRHMFGKWNARFVNFVEVAELERIDVFATDPAIDLVKRQIKEFDADGFEIGFHLHPQWCESRYDNGRWFLNFSDYNLCNLT